MSYTTELNQIINSLSKRERNAFETGWATPDSAYLLMFQWKCESDEITDKEIKERLRKLGIKQSLPKVRQKLSERLKAFLIAQLLTDSDTSNYGHMYEFLYIAALKKRGVLSKMSERLEKMKTQAEEGASYHIMLYVLQFDLSFSQIDVVKFKELLKTYRTAVEHSDILNKLRLTFFSMFSFHLQHGFYYTNPQEWDEIVEQLPAALLQNNVDPRQIQLSVIFFETQILYHTICADKKAVYYYCDQLEELTVQHPTFFRQHEFTPVIFHKRFMNTCYFADHSIPITQYKNTLSKLQEFPYHQSRQIYHEIRLMYVLIAGNRDEIYNTIEERDQYYISKNLPVLHTEKAHRLLQLTEDYEQALSYLEKDLAIMKMANQLYSENMMRVDELLLLIDNGAIAVIPSKVEAYRKWLNRNLPHIDKNSAEYLVIKHLPRLFDINQKFDKQKASEFLIALQAFPNQDHVLLHHFYGGLVPWLQSKINGRPYWDVVQDRIKNQLVS